MFSFIFIFQHFGSIHLRSLARCQTISSQSKQIGIVSSRTTTVDRFEPAIADSTSVSHTDVLLEVQN
jgi:hypothetical protein